jgi:hypothetical protein
MNLKGGLLDGSFINKSEIPEVVFFESLLD